MTARPAVTAAEVVDAITFLTSPPNPERPVTIAEITEAIGRARTPADPGMHPRHLTNALVTLAEDDDGKRIAVAHPADCLVVFGIPAQHGTNARSWLYAPAESAARWREQYQTRRARLASASTSATDLAAAFTSLGLSAEHAAAEMTDDGTVRVILSAHGAQVAAKWLTFPGRQA